MKKEINSPVLIFQRVLPNYRKDVFDELSKEIDIRIIFSQYKSKSFLPNANIQSKYYIEVKAYKLSRSVTSILQNPMPLLKQYKPKVIVCESSPSYLTLWLIMLLKPFFKYKIILWGHGTRYHISNPYIGLRGLLLKFLHKSADALLLYSENRAKRLRSFPEISKKIFVANNTLNTKKLSGIREKIKYEDLTDFKREHYFHHKFNLIFVGRLLEQKGFKQMFEVHRILAESFDVGFHIVGEGPMREVIEAKMDKYTNIHYHGPIYDESELARFIICSDLFFNLGYVGLSIVHAFSFACPFITTIGPDHSPEIEYLIHGKNGFISENSTESIVELIKGLLNDELRLKQMKIEAKTTINSMASIDSFISGFKNSIHHVLHEF